MNKDPYKKFMKGDDYWRASRDALRGLDYQIGQVQGELNSSIAAGERESAASAVQQLADLSRQKENVMMLRNQYAASRMPQQPVPKTAEETAATPIERLDANELMDVYRNSKYGKDLTWNDRRLRRPSSRQLRPAKAREPRLMVQR